MCRSFLSYVLVVVALLGCTVNAFAPPTPSISAQQTSPLSLPTVPVSDISSQWSSETVLAAAKKEDDDSKKNEATSFARAISPYNPYMWFIYFFLFIYGWDFAKTNGLV